METRHFTRVKDSELGPNATTLVEEFERLALDRNWAPGSKRYRQQKQKYFAREFHQQFGQDENRLHGWQNLCRDVGIDPPPESIGQCKKVET